MKVVFVFTAAVVAVAIGTPAHSGGKIIEADDAFIADFPYFLQLERNGFLIGGASIYNGHTAITSAYSTAGIPVSELKLRSGSDKRGSGGFLHQAVNIIIHPKYVYPDEDYDVALVIVDEPFDTKNAIPLTTSPPPVGAHMNVTGMGYITIGGGLSSNLQTKSIKAVDLDECKDSYQGTGATVTDNMICAELSAWSHDEGDPLEYLGQLAGIFTNSVELLPGIYADISKLGSWIQDNAV